MLEYERQAEWDGEKRVNRKGTSYRGPVGLRGNLRVRMRREWCAI